MKGENVSKAIDDVLAERQRQQEVEGWTAEHDDQHKNGGMALAAACYAMSGSGLNDRVRSETVGTIWPWTGWAWAWWKPKEKRRDLVRAAALLLAEIERIDRAMKPKWKPCGRCTTPDYCTNQLRGCDIAESLEAGIEPIAGSVTPNNRI